MEIELNEEQVMLRDTVRRFAAEVVAPRAREIDASGEFPIDYYHQAGVLGLAGVCVPEEFGGAGMDMVSYCVAIEEISRVCASSGVILSVNNSLVCDPLMRYATDEQKREFLSPLAAGKKLGCFALTEPEAGSDAAALKTTAKRDGEDYILNGSKVFITNGTHADTALVFATVDPAQKHRGITAFIVEMDSPGFSRGHHEYKLGVQASGTTQLYFDNLRVPARQRLGDEGKGFGVAMSTLDGGRIGIAAQALGIARAAYEDAGRYALERKTFGQPIANHQSIQWKLADMATEIDAARLLTLRAATLKDKGVRYSKEAAMAKLFASEAANHAAKEGVQIFGGNGYVEDFPAERHFRDAKITEIYEGTSEIMRLVIAGAVLKE
jgi:butyryl-CoA dehydrogenase